MMARLLGVVLLLVAGALAAQPVEIAPSRTFQLFDGTLYRHKPAMSQHGIATVEILYAGRFWPNMRSRRSLEQLPDERVVRRVAREALAVGHPVVIDIEHWPLDGDEASMRENLAKYVTVLQWMRNEAPALRIGYFGRLPEVAYRWSLQDESSRDYQRWQALNRRLDDLATLVDAIYLPLYTYFPDRDGWVGYATAHLR